jgi:hypothetical protein
MQDTSQPSGSDSLGPGSKDTGTATLEANLQAVRVARALRVGAIIQDLADSTLALNDIRGGWAASTSVWHQASVR